MVFTDQDIPAPLSDRFEFTGHCMPGKDDPKTRGRPSEVFGGFTDVPRA
jgi:hypothetical protein